MICPNCGNEIEDDKLYCEKCGQEISFVPEYDPELEESITQSLSDISIDNEDEYYEDGYYDEFGNFIQSFYDEDGNIIDGYYDENGEFIEIVYVDEPAPAPKPHKNSSKKKHKKHYDSGNELHNIKRELAAPKMVHGLSDSLYDEMLDNEDIQDELDSLGDEYDLDPFDDFAVESLYLKRFRKWLRKSKLKWVFLLLLLALLGLLFVGVKKLTSKVSEETSYEYQLSLANEARANGNYSLAIEYMEKAINLKDDSTLKLTLSELYFMNNDADNAILMLWDIISYHDENEVVAYETIINHYIELQDFATISEIIATSGNDVIKQEYVTYTAAPPVFNVSEGTYEDAINLVLSSDNAGFIYYTLDGNEPTTDSDMYVTPIYMDLGIYRVSAFFVNQFGIRSETVSMTYTIDIKVPNAPTLVTEEGVYTSPEMIELDLQPYTTVYYTTDGSVPTNQSAEYKGPFPMPLGTTYFCFVAYSQEGVAGAFTTAEFTLEIESELDLNAIMYYLYVYDFVAGRTSSIDGYQVGTNNKYYYSCNVAVDIDGNTYYVITETLVDSTGNTSKTGVSFLTDVESGDIYIASTDEEGNYVRGDFVDPAFYTVTTEEDEQ